MINFFADLIIDIFAFSILPGFKEDSDCAKVKHNPWNFDKPKKHPTIAESISSIRKAASKIYGPNNVNTFLDTPFIDGLSPWQLTINGRASEVLRKLNCLKAETLAIH